MQRLCVFKIILFITFSLIICNSVFAQYQIQRYTFGNGCGKMESASHASINTLGQPLIGFCSNPSHYTYLGFWYTVDIIVAIPEALDLLPKQFELYQNYPNPFNPTTNIEFDLPKTSDVTLKIFNILGEEVAILVSDRLNAGSYKYQWDALGMASGVYMYRLEAGDYVETRKMVVMR